MRGHGRRDSSRGAVRDAPDADRISDEACRAFVAEYGPGPRAPIAVVMPAFNEAATVARVVAAVPARIAGLDTVTIVIDDGSTDGTAGPAREAGALVGRLAVNLGQGHALRLGYRVARQGGATLIATIDADGQFDPAELPALMAPLVAGTADFVTGSRRLGRTEATDPVRKAGLVAFSVLIRILTGASISDPATGLRAFRAEVTERVPLRQTQYQASELLIGALARGFRVEEVPATVYARGSGTTKKGGNFSYGIRFAMAVLTTWWSVRPVARPRRGGPPPRPDPPA
jgi:glycosyltransferase involved in cell wall biosynthesis